MRKFLKIFTIILAVVLVWVTYGIVRSYGWPVISTYDIVSDKIHESRKICVIADLHSKKFSTLVSQIRDENPDLIVMAGDMFDREDTELTDTFDVIRQLSEVADVYFALGNHELRHITQDSTFLQKLKDMNVKIIDKEYFDVGSDLRIGGLYDYPFGWNKGGHNTADSAPEDVQKYMSAFMDTDRFRLFVAHRPESFYFSDCSEVYPIDLVISAHIHGGQVVVPLKGGLYGADQGWWPEYVHGYYQKNKINWLITSGLSTSRKALPRFNNPPEICMINLTAKAPKSDSR